MSKILININNLDMINEYEKIGITNFLFAIPEFSIGYTKIPIASIPSNAYILINRVLDTESIDKLKRLAPELMRFKGIFFEDVGVFNIFSNTNLELIWYQNHFATNASSINTWLDLGAASAVISNELTQEEIKDIIASSHKPLVFTILGKNQIMYSRRTLLSNFNEYSNLPENHKMTLKEPHTNNTFLALEEKNGTIIYNDEYFNYVKLQQEIPDDKIKFYLVMNLDLHVEQIKDILDGQEFGSSGFLSKKTVYRMSEYNDR